MESVNVKEARQKFARLVGQARRGRSVTLTRRGKAVALLTPPEPAHRRFPDLSAFRASLGKPSKSIIGKLRENQRY